MANLVIQINSSTEDKKSRTRKYYLTALRSYQGSNEGQGQGTGEDGKAEVNYA